MTINILYSIGLRSDMLGGSSNMHRPFVWCEVQSLVSQQRNALAHA